MSNDPETLTFENIVNHYLTGISDAKNAKHHIDQAFYSSTNLHTLDANGQLSLQPRDGLIHMVETGQVPDHTSQILNIKVTHDIALAKVRIDLADRQFFDYLTLLKLHCGWRIVSKTYTTVMQ